MPRPMRLRARRGCAGFRFERFRSCDISASYSTRTRWRTFLSIPASCGLSACSAVRPILPRPSARRVPRCLALWPIELRVWVIRSFAISGCFLRRFGFLRDLRPHRQNLLDRQAARLGDLVRAAEALEAVDRRLEHVDRVRRAETLRQDVADSGQLEDGADAATGDDAGSLARRPQQDTRRAELAEDLVRDGRPVLGHDEEILLRVVDGLRDRQRHLTRLAVAQAHALVLVADHDECGEREPPPALDHLGDAVDLDHALLELSRFALVNCHLDLQASFACRFGQRLDAAVVEVAAAVEDGGVDTGLLRPLRAQLADFGRLRGLVALELAQMEPARSGKRAALEVVHELRLDPAVRAEHDQTRPFGGAENLRPHPLVSTLARLPDRENAHAGRSSRHTGRPAISDGRASAHVGKAAMASNAS